MHCSYGTLEPKQTSPVDQCLPNIDVLDPSLIDYRNFYENYLLKNKPCIFTKNITTNWKAIQCWVTDGKVNLNFLRQIYGDVEVSVTRVTDVMSMEYEGMDCETMKFTEYLEYWIKYIESDHPATMPCLYLKDWHILKNSGNASDNPYETPKYFSSDWLNETSEDQSDDYRFAYMGPKGSWTPFHADVYGSFSWSANIIGRKRWRLYPPGKERMFTQPNDQIKYDYSKPGVLGKDFIETVQDAGEIIFVPSGWHHIVWNETDTISINHNWFNAANICYIWFQLRTALDQVIREISDLKLMDGFSDQCQLILKANHAMNFNSFVEIILKIFINRGTRHQATDDAGKEDNFDQVNFDLNILRHLIQEHVLHDPNLDGECSRQLRNNLISPINGSES